MLTTLLVLLTIPILTGRSADTQQGRPRERIALNGFISHGTTGIPRWSVGEAALAGEAGDLVILRATAKPGERIEAGVYLFYKTIDKNGKPTGDWTGVPSSQRGIDWQYRSRTLKCTCAVVRFVNPRQKDSDYDLPLLPYAATALPAGRYQFAYLVQVRANKSLADEFWIDHVATGTVGPSGLVRQGTSQCACFVTDGPCLTPFRLKGTTDPVAPSPESAPEPSRSEE